MKNNKKEKKYLINEVAKMVELSQKRIRDYEKEGLLKPVRAPRTNNRIYVDCDVKRIRRIKQLIHEYGFTLSCLKFFLVSAHCWIIFDCTEKTSCAAYKRPHSRCYEIMQSISPSHLEKCNSCPVFVNRDQKAIALFKKSE